MTDIVQAQAAEPTLSDEHVAEVAGSVTRLVHLFSRSRARVLDSAQYEGEWAAKILLAVLVMHGPMRAGALADRLQSDPSTISRQIASLVREGMVERQPDPEDRRASLLVATSKANEAHQRHLDHRNTHFRAMLADWDDHDCALLATLVARLNEDFERYKNTVAAEGWTRPVGREGRS
ncbi:MAG: MarR family winged helix-turn-helix transcriptional regulator [Frankia sp.]